MSVIEQKRMRGRPASRERMPVSLNNQAADRGRKTKKSIAGSASVAIIAGVVTAIFVGLLMMAITCPILVTTADPAKSVGKVALIVQSIGAFCGGAVMARILGRRNIWLSLAAALILNTAIFVMSFVLPDLSADMSLLGWLKRVLAVLLFILGAYIAAPGAGLSRRAYGSRSRIYKKR